MIRKCIIAAMNQKGGVGKTLTVALLAEWFALIRHLKVLIVDLDMQCNSTDQWIGMELAPNAVGGQLPPKYPDWNQSLGISERSTIADIFYGIPIVPYSSWLDEDLAKGGCVDVLCGHPQKLEEINIAFNKTDGQLDQKVHNRLREFLRSQEVLDLYDIILLDTGPSRNPIFRAAMRAASHIIIPFKPENKDMQGITAMLQVIKQENYSRPNNLERLDLVGLLPNMIRSTKIHKKNLTLMKKNHSDITFSEECWLPLSTTFPDRDSKDARPKSVFELSPDEPARIKATNMVNFVEKRIFGKELRP